MRLPKRPSVSLILATWNGEAYLREQLDSLAVQTVLPMELIVMDDHSSDGTVEILRRFALTSPFPMTMARQLRRVGYERNFADAGRRASGELLLFVDQDDLWHPRKIEVISAHATDLGSGVLVHDFEMFGPDGEAMIPSFFDHLESMGLPRDICVHGCVLAITRACVDQWGWPPTGSGISHDSWFGLLGSATDDRSFLPERLIRHRIHGQNASGWIPKADERMLDLAELLAVEGPSPFDALLELFIGPGNRSWLEPLQTALHDRASPFQEQLAARAIRKLHIVGRWLDRQGSA
jgi:glycosyltransferase involved in cell wall biosynthesis